MGRTKGSKNGISTTPGYVAIGQKAQNNWQQQAELERWKKQNRNNIAAKKKADAAKQQELIKKADASYAANQGKANNWQNQANAQRAMKEYMNKASAERKAAEKSKQKSVDRMQAQGAANNWQEMGNQRRAAIEAFVKAATGKSNTADIRGMDRKAREEATVRYINDAVSTNAKYRKQQSDLYGAGDAKTRNARSDVKNAYEDAKLEAKNAFLAAKEKAGAKLYTKISYLNNKFKKKKKK